MQEGAPQCGVRPRSLAAEALSLPMRGRVSVPLPSCSFSSPSALSPTPIAQLPAHLRNLPLRTRATCLGTRVAARAADMGPSRAHLPGFGNNSCHDLLIDVSRLRYLLHDDICVLYSHVHLPEPGSNPCHDLQIDVSKLRYPLLNNMYVPYVSQLPRHQYKRSQGTTARSSRAGGVGKFLYVLCIQDGQDMLRKAETCAPFMRPDEAALNNTASLSFKYIICHQGRQEYMSKIENVCGVLPLNNNKIISRHGLFNYGGESTFFFENISTQDRPGTGQRQQQRGTPLVLPGVYSRGDYEGCLDHCRGPLNCNHGCLMRTRPATAGLGVGQIVFRTDTARGTGLKIKVELLMNTWGRDLWGWKFLSGSAFGVRSPMAAGYAVLYTDQPP